jgi:hypothetical protein
MASWGFITSDNETVADALPESVTVIETVLVPAELGVPLMVPEVDMERPEGNPVADQVSLPAPPDALSVVL